MYFQSRAYLFLIYIILSISCVKGTLGEQTNGKDAGTSTQTDPTNKPRVGDDGEGVPGYLTDPNTVDVALEGTLATYLAPAGSIVGADGKAAGQVLIAALSIDRNVLSTILSTTEPVVFLNGELRGRSLSSPDGSFRLSFELKGDDPIVLRFGENAASPAIRIERSPSLNRGVSAGFSDPKAQIKFESFETSTAAGTAPKNGVLFSDAFEREDGESVGTGWVASGGRLGLRGKQVVSLEGSETMTGTIRAKVANTSDVEIQVKVSDNVGEFYLRARSFSGSGYLFFLNQIVDPATGKKVATVTLRRRPVTGGETDLKKANLTSIGGNWKFQLMGDSIKVLQDGQVTLDVKDPTPLVAPGSTYFNLRGTQVSIDDVVMVPCCS